MPTGVSNLYLNTSGAKRQEEIPATAGACASEIRKIRKYHKELEKLVFTRGTAGFDVREDIQVCHWLAMLVKLLQCRMKGSGE